MLTPWTDLRPNPSPSKSNKDYFFICTGIDDNYLWPWMVSIFSAQIHSKRRLRVGLGVIEGNFSPKNLAIVKNFCNFLKIELLYKEFAFDFQVQLEHLPKETYIRILWMDALDEPFLWLDSDTLPLPGWNEIFSFLGNDDEIPIICAVEDTKIISKREKSPKNLAYQRGGCTYFNAGVFVANPLKWKEKRFSSTWKEVGVNFKELGFMHHDQDILNYVLSSDKRMIPGKFNVIASHPTQIEQSILHFAGGPKPWHLDSTAADYYSAVESSKGSSQEGAFSGKNWLFEFGNYWRHEHELLKFVAGDNQLFEVCSILRNQARTRMMNRIDHLKFAGLKLIGRKWLK